MVNKNTKIVIWSVVAIILILIAAISLLFMTGTIKFPTETVLRGGGELGISNINDSAWNLFVAGGGAIQGDSNGIMNLVIRSPTQNGVKQQMLCDKINALTDETCSGQEESESTSTFNSRVFEQYNRLLGDQFVIMEGSFLDRSADLINFRTYGICEGFNCKVLDPSPQTTGASINNPGSAVNGGNNFESGFISISSMVSYFKEGGYTEQDGKIEFEFQEKTIYRLIDNECIQTTAFQSQITDLDFNTLSECQEQIDQIIEVYRLEENTCNLISILESTRTQNDFDDLETCEDNKESIFKSTTAISIAIGIIAIFIILVVVFLIVRRKK